MKVLETEHGAIYTMPTEEGRVAAFRLHEALGCDVKVDYCQSIGSDVWVEFTLPAKRHAEARTFLAGWKEGALYRINREHMARYGAFTHESGPLVEWLSRPLPCSTAKATPRAYGGLPKLSAKQLGCLWHFVNGHGYGWDFGAGTLSSLRKLGYLETFKASDTGHVQWRITETGREALSLVAKVRKGCVVGSEDQGARQAS